jgi:hypothetical protein
MSFQFHDEEIAYLLVAAFIAGAFWFFSVLVKKIQRRRNRRRIEREMANYLRQAGR